MSTPHTGRAAQVSATTAIRFDGFAGLPAQKNEGMLSEEFTCLGNEWQLEVFPGGYEDADEGMVSVYLRNVSEKSIKVEFGFSVEDCVDIDRPKIFLPNNFFRPVGSKGSAFGYTHYELRSKIMDSLVDGARPSYQWSVPKTLFVFVIHKNYR